jgi:hypothetical protein
LQPEIQERMDNRRYEIEGRPDLIVYSQSSIKEFGICPKRYQFGVHYGEEVSDIIGAKANVRHGAILERMILGDFDGKLGLVEDPDDHTKIEYSTGGGTLVGSIYPKTMRALWSTALPIRMKYFKEDQLETNRQEKIVSVIDDSIREKLGMEKNGFVYGVGSELDFRGSHLIDLPPGAGRKNRLTYWIDEAIVDLKTTADVGYSMYGDDAFSKLERIQAAMYTMQVWIKYGKILPFVYSLVETKKAGYEELQKDVDAILKPYIFKVSLNTFKWLIGYIDAIHNATSFKMEASPFNCLGVGNRGARCRFYLHCPGARNQIMNLAGEYEWDLMPDKPVYE